MPKTANQVSPEQSLIPTLCCESEFYKGAGGDLKQLAINGQWRFPTQLLLIFHQLSEPNSFLEIAQK